MPLDFEKLTEKVDEMARTAGARNQTRHDRLADVLAFVQDKRLAWQELERQQEYLENSVLNSAQPRPFRGSAHPLHYDKQALDEAVPFTKSHLPPCATIIAADGSQIVPDRHAAFTYYLINIGGIIYYHGQKTADAQPRPPQPFSEPTLLFPTEIELDDDQFTNYARITIQRDLNEIDALAFHATEQKEADIPLLAIMDQRLLYVPTGELAPKFKHEVVEEWQGHMRRFQQAGAWLAGYIDSPRKSSVMAMLRGIHPDRNPNDLNDMGEWAGLTDVDLYGRLLQPGQRSKLFMEVSFANKRFGRDNKVCFFYFNSGQTINNIARVDLPHWVAQDSAAVTAIHALLYDQCCILGNYPYVITRADEVAVVQRRDQEELEFRIGRRMDEYGLDTAAITAKAQTKLFARSEKKRFEQ